MAFGLDLGGFEFSGVDVKTEALIKSVQVRSTAFDDGALEQVYAKSTEGATTRTLEIGLRRNALVLELDVVVTAATASVVAAGVAGQIRTSAKGGGKTSIVVDFGTLRTVARVMLPTGVAATTISTWIGTKFTDPVNVEPPKQSARLPSEVRTERIEVIVTGTVDASRLATEMFFVMPDLPSGLELRIDDGPPVFTHPAPVQPGEESALSDADWNTDARRIVHLADAFAKLTGDATRDEEVTFKLTLSSRAPGLLDLTEAKRELQFIRRATFDGAAEKDIEFESEGRTTLHLENLPAGLAVKEVRWIASATVPPTRVLPAVGPEPSGVAEIRITADRAIIMRLDPATLLGELSHLRLPLRTGPSGAEARVVLWSNKEGANQPLEALEAGASEPQSIAKNDTVEWLTFDWVQPVAIPAAGLWAALTLNRGEAYFEFAATSTGTSWATVLWGAPAGPWRDLPAALAGQRGRVRLVGTPRSGTKIDPYRLSLDLSSGQGFTPNPKGVAGVLNLAQAVTQTGKPELVITSHVAARLKLRDVEVVSTN